MKRTISLLLTLLLVLALCPALWLNPPNWSSLLGRQPWT